MTGPLHGLVAESLRRHADEPALVFGDAALAYGELDEAVEALAERLRSAAGGADVAGATVAVIAPNAPALVVSLLAVWRVGAVAVPLNARLREHELSQILADAEPLLVLSVTRHLGFAFDDFLPRLLPRLPTVRACLLLQRSGSVASTVRGADSAGAGTPLPPETAAVLYTSGTTGVPKGVLVSHAREAAAAPELASVLGLSSGDRVALVIPASHAFGLTCLLAALATGATTVLVESTTTLGPLLAALQASSANVLHGSPGLFTSLLKARPGALEEVRAGFVGGAPSPPALLERLDDVGILNLYGLTETGAVSSCRRDDPRERRRTTAGRPLPGVEVRVVDGELHVRGHAVTTGYLRRPEESATAFADGWFRTGDAAELDDGYVRIRGRERELVHVGGFNVFPAEVEAALLTHPAVGQAAVVGVRDERMGEVLRAFVVPQPGEELQPAALLRFARTQIAGYKLPYAIDVVSELPLLPSGKPDRGALAAR